MQHRRPITVPAAALAAVLAGGLAIGQVHDHRSPAASGPASPWSRPVQLGGSGAIGSPGGTHPLALDEIIYAAWVQDGVVHLAKSGDGGATWDHASRITAGGTALYPCSLELAGPALHLVWPDSRNGGWEPYYKLSVDGGKTWTAEVRLAPGTDLFRLGTAVSGSNVHVVWFSKHLLEKVPAGDQTWTWTWGEVYHGRSTDGGATWEKALRLTVPDSTACRPVIAASGKFVHVAWVDNRDARQRPGWDWEIYYKRSADGGATWGPDVRMSENEWHSRHPQIMTAGGDRVCCVWEDGAIWDGKTASGWSGDGALYAAVSDDNGQTWKPARRITTVNSPNGRATHAKSFATGSRLFVGWTDAVEGGAHKPIMAEAAYFTMSTDGGLAWSPAERLAVGLPGEWAVDAVAGDATMAIALLSRGDTIHATVRRSPAADPSPPASHATFRVKDFGAAGDGVRDDTAAIQDAIHAAEAAGGGTVKLEDGTYLLDSGHPSSHPWFFYNLKIGSNVTLQGRNGTKLLQGPGGRRPLADRATEVRNTVLAFGSDYTVIRFQNTACNGGFHGLQGTTADSHSVTLSDRRDASRFKDGDYVAIYKTTKGDVIPTETSRITSVDAGTGALHLEHPLSRSFPAPSIANVTSLATTNVAVQDIAVQGSEPIAVTETFGFTARNCQFIIDTSVGERNVLNLNLNTLHDFKFIGNTFTSVGPRFAGIELPQRNSRHGLFDGNVFIVSSAGFGEYAAHVTFTNNRFTIHADPSVSAGIAIGGLDVSFSHNDVRGGDITCSSGWGAMLADFIGPADYAEYAGKIRIADNTFDCRADGNACLGIFARDTCVTGNTITVRGNGLGIHAEGPLPQSVRIQGNRLSMGSGDGILIATPATGGGGSTISGNGISGSGAHGIFIDARSAPKAGGITTSDNRIEGFKTPVAIR